VNNNVGDPGLFGADPDPRIRTPDKRIRIQHSISSVADPGCLSRIPYPDFYPSRIPDPKTATKERGEKKLVVIGTFLCSHKFHKIVNYNFSLEVLKKKIWANFQRIIELFTKKIVKKLYKIWSWDPGSGIRDPGSGKNLFRIPDPGVKKHPIPDPGSGSATLSIRIISSVTLRMQKKTFLFVFFSYPQAHYLRS
jgi:hypothetical protein